MSLLRHADLVPGRQALDVRRENIARRHWYTHAQDAAREQFVSRRGTRAVDVRKLDDEVVDRLNACTTPSGFALGHRAAVAGVHAASLLTPVDRVRQPRPA